MDTPTGYGFTQIAAVEIAARILAGDFAVGFQTPASGGQVRPGASEELTARS